MSAENPVTTDRLQQSLSDFDARMARRREAEEAAAAKQPDPQVEADSLVIENLKVRLAEMAKAVAFFGPQLERLAQVLTVEFTEYEPTEQEHLADFAIRILRDQRARLNPTPSILQP